jgi:predicted glycosyltransferase
MNARPVVFFYVQHLHGVGHAFRASRIARAMVRAGAQVHLVWGGTRIPSINLEGLDMVWLDPLRASDITYSQLERPDGQPVNDAFLQARANRLLETFHAIRPDILITETFPFGRRQMRFEVLPLMDAADKADWPVTRVSSIRDILQEGRKESRIRETLDEAKNWFDLVLVHGDPQLAKISETLPHAHEIEDRIAYSGLVAPAPTDLNELPEQRVDVVVSAGGGADGHALISAALQARRFSRHAPQNWLLITGSERNDAEARELANKSGEGLRIERFVPDLTLVMAHARASVSRAGYNTACDLLRARCPAVLVPYVGGNQTEQLRRARIFQSRGLAVMLRDEELTPQSLADAVDRAIERPAVAVGFDLDGAANSARIILDRWRSHRTFRQAVGGT